MAFDIPGFVVFSICVIFASTQALILWRVGQLEKKFDNGINQRLKDIEVNCTKMHARRYAGEEVYDVR
jgi:hypothetical protein